MGGQKNRIFLLTTMIFTTFLWIFPYSPPSLAADQWKPGFGLLMPSNFNDNGKMDPLPVNRLFIQVRILENLARVSSTMIFRNPGDQELEGSFMYRIPPQGVISSFALWDGQTRIPGVIVERKRARKIYEEITARKRDPGLLSQGETDEDSSEAAGSTLFSCKVFPIPPRGSKRVEITYDALLPIDAGKILMTIPLRSNQELAVDQFEIRISLAGNLPLSEGSAILEEDQRSFSSSTLFRGKNRVFQGDLLLSLQLDTSLDRVSLAAFREPADQGNKEQTYFMALALPSAEKESPALEQDPACENLIAMDTSFSMNPELLQASMDIVLTLLGSMKEGDRFGLLLFNDNVQNITGGLIPFSRKSLGLAMQGLRDHLPGGGTNLASLAVSASEIFAAARKSGTPNSEEIKFRNLILISDGFQTIEEQGGRPGQSTLEAFSGLLKETPGLRLNIFAPGDRVNTSLLSLPTGARAGSIIWCRTDDQYLARARAMASRLRRPGYLQPTFSWSSIEKDLYLSDGTSSCSLADAPAFYPGQGVCVLGRLNETAPAKTLPWTFEAQGTESGMNLLITGEASPAGLADQRPGQTDSEEIPAMDKRVIARMWAMARVDELVRLQETRGEDQDQINEIISLSKKFSLVTPYTSFLAAPRSLLRPRIIQPGDPEITVTTDAQITRILALLPFGQDRPMHLVEETPTQRKWRLRFLAPAWLPEGRHSVELVLTDQSGQSISEKKWFAIDCSPPELKLIEPPSFCRRGSSVELKADASSDTRRITAYLSGTAPAELKWSAHRKLCLGTLFLSPGLTPGVHRIKVVAEDFARNTTTREISLTVVAAAPSQSPGGEK